MKQLITQLLETFSLSDIENKKDFEKLIKDFFLTKDYNVTKIRYFKEDSCIEGFVTISLDTTCVSVYILSFMLDYSTGDMSIEYDLISERINN